MRTIPELDSLEQLENAEERYEREFGLPPVNLSHWDPSKETKGRLLAKLSLSSSVDPIDYIYPNTIGRDDDVKRLLGFMPNETALVLAPSSTSALLSALRWALGAGCSELHLLCPRYFAVSHGARLLGLRVAEWPMEVGDNTASIPSDILGHNLDRAALFVTNPVFSTGKTIGKDGVAILIEYLRRGGAVILDECLADLENIIGPRLPSHTRLLGIYSPHKSICINAVKFAALVCHQASANELIQWADVIYGGLSCSSQLAVQHFCGDNYSVVRNELHAILQESHHQLVSTIAKFPSVRAISSKSSHFATLCITKLESMVLESKETLWEATRLTGSVILTGRRCGAPKEWGLSFRVNLARHSPQFWPALTRMLKYLTAID